MKIFLVLGLLVGATADTLLCPPGFTFLPSAGKCYQAVFEHLDWNSANQKCQGLTAGSHLAAIVNAEENSAVKSFLASELAKNISNSECLCDWPWLGEMFWTSGQRQIENSCDSPLVWKVSSDKQLPFEFTSWYPGEPNCEKNLEFCVHVWPKHEYNWNDIMCDKTVCALCEYNP